jgi:catechol 2,3-dioxygenase-like lactoylglutathione lyase family enzyme
MIMKILNIAHVSYRVSDLNKSLEFYEKCLGLKRKFTLMNTEAIAAIQGAGEVKPEYQQYLEYLNAHKDDIWLVYLEVAPRQLIELFPGTAGMPLNETAMSQTGYLHLSLEVDDIYSAREELLEKNVNITSEVSLGIEKTYQFWVKDPDGNPIEFFQYTEDSYQIRGRE